MHEMFSVLVNALLSAEDKRFFEHPGFDVVRIMTQGGPVHATQLFVYAIYEQIFLNLRVGRASALTVVFGVLVFALAALQLRLLRGRAAA